MRPPQAPAHLGTAGARLWRATVRAFDLETVDLAMLEQACGAADRCRTLAAEADGQPSLITGRLGQRISNPVYSELRAERRMLAHLLASMGLMAGGHEPGATVPERRWWH